MSERTSSQGKHIRFTPREDREIDDMVRYLGTSIQNYVKTATLAQLEKDKLKREADKEQRGRRKAGEERKPVVRGLGLRFNEPRSEPPAPAAPAAPQVVVNVPAATSSGGTSELAMLADFVVKGGPLLRTTRREQARAIIASSAEEASREQLFAQLDAAIEAREPKRGGALDWLKSAR